VRRVTEDIEDGNKSRRKSVYGSDGNGKEGERIKVYVLPGGGRVMPVGYREPGWCSEVRQNLASVGLTGR